MEHNSDRPDENPGGNKSALDQLQDDSYSRDKFLKLVGGAGALGAFGTLLSACGDNKGNGNKTTHRSNNGNTQTTPPSNTQPAPKQANGDLAIVNYALTLEYLEAAFYAKVIDSGLFKGKELDLIKIIGQHEAEHVQALKGVAQSLGTPAAKPETNFPVENREAVLKLAAIVENVGAAAYLGQAGKIQSMEILAAALSIHSVEARHASALNFLTGKNITPDGAFAKAMSMEEVLPKVQPFIVSSSTNNTSGGNK